jgi:multidrug efflux system membrane fusion protein
MNRALLNKDYWHSKASEFYRARSYRQPRFWIIVATVLILIILLHHYSTTLSTKQRNPGLPVVTSLSKSIDIPVRLSALGAVTPKYTVTVKSQINGRLFQVFYQEGQMVKNGDLLAQIDPRPYLAQLAQYTGQLARDKALLANALLDLNRYKTLWGQDSVAKQTLDTQTSLVHQYEGDIATDEGLIQTTRVNLIYCQITAPIDGRIGLRLVDPGNFVQTSDTTGLAVITMLSPITVIFTLPEDNVPVVMEEISAGKTLSVDAYNRQNTKLLATGTLLTMDNQIDPTTGTVKLRAQFPNTDSHLFPSQFVNIQLLVKTLNKITSVPTAAIQHGSEGAFVYVVNSDNTVSVKPVKTGITTDENTAVKSGITPGQAVVVEGADKLTNGAKVVVANNQTPPRTRS